MDSKNISQLLNGYNVDKKNYNDYLQKTKEPKLKQNAVRSYFQRANARFGIVEYFVNKNIEKAKEHFYYAGLVSEYLNNHYQEAWLAYGFKNFTYPFLSDNLELINRMGHLHIHPAIEGTEKTEGCIILSLMSLIKEDWNEIEQHLNTLQSFLNRSSKPSPYIPIHIATLEAFRDRDIPKLEAALKEYDRPRLKAHRKKVRLQEHFISFMPLGFAKLAWIKGMEVKVDSPYVPAELLPIKPLKQYKIPYWFLKEYYKEQGIKIDNKSGFRWLFGLFRS